MGADVLGVGVGLFLAFGDGLEECESGVFSLSEKSSYCELESWRWTIAVSES